MENRWKFAGKIPPLNYQFSMKLIKSAKLANITMEGEKATTGITEIYFHKKYIKIPYASQLTLLSLTL